MDAATRAKILEIYFGNIRMGQAEIAALLGLPISLIAAVLDGKL